MNTPTMAEPTDPTFQVVNKLRIPQGTTGKAGTSSFKFDFLEGLTEERRLSPSGGISNDGGDRVRLLIENIRKFNGNPPAPEITSLTVVGIKDLSELKLSPKAKRMLKSFAAFWYPKLTELKVDYFDHFLSPDASFVTQLLSVPSLQRFSCDRIGNERMDENEQLQTLFPGRFFNLPHVTLGCVELEGNALVQFFDRLAANPPRYFDIRSTNWNLDTDTESYLQAITQFVKLTNELPDPLELAIDMSGWTVKQPNRLKNFCSLVEAIVVDSSSSKVRLTGFRRWMRKRAMEFFAEEEARQLFETVEGAFGLSPRDFPEFPNLKRLIVSKKEKEDFVFFEGLEKLIIKNRFSASHFPTLSHLTLKNYTATFGEMMRSLVILNDAFPLLTSLQLGWMFTVLEDDWSSSSEVTKRLGNFSFLTSLEFSVDLHVNVGERSAKLSRESRLSLVGKKAAVVKVLLSGFQLPELTLTHLTFVVGGTPSGSERMLSRDTLTRMLEGKLAQSLVSLKVRSAVVAEDAIRLWVNLMEKVAGNAKKQSKSEEAEYSNLPLSN